jgi:hypothetical protein
MRLPGLRVSTAAVGVLRAEAALRDEALSTVAAEIIEIWAAQNSRRVWAASRSASKR